MVLASAGIPIGTIVYILFNLDKAEGLVAKFGFSDKLWRGLNLVECSHKPAAEIVADLVRLAINLHITGKHKPSPAEVAANAGPYKITEYDLDDRL